MADTKKVTRITAKDETPKKASASTKAVKARVVAKKTTVTPESTHTNVLARIGGYFKGAWVELRQVRWPNRRATWALTLAVIVFSLVFMALIVLLDAFFKWIFELIIA